MTNVLAGAIHAFVDRAPIDWRAVLDRKSSASDRSALEGLLLLDTLRASFLAQSPPAIELSSPLRVRIVLWLSIAQTMSSIAVLLLAVAAGVSPQGRAIQMVLSSSFLAASLLLVTATSRDPRTTILVAWFMCATSVFASSVVTGLPESRWSLLHMPLQAVRIEAFLPACAWQFAQVFPQVRRFTTFDRVSRQVTTLLWILGALLLSVNFAAVYWPVEATALQSLLRNHPTNVFWYTTALLLCPAVIAVFVRARRASRPERQKVLNLSLALVFGTGPFLLLCAVLASSPRLNRWISTVQPSEIFWLDAVVAASLAVTPVLVSAAVIVDRPFRPRATLGWLWRHTLMRGGLNALLAAPFVVLGFALYDQRDMAIRDILPSLGAPLLLACGAALAFALTGRTRVLRALDRMESRRAIEHHQQLARAIERVRTARGVREIADVLTRELCRGTGAIRASVLVPQLHGFAADSDPTTVLPTELGALFGRMTCPVDVSTDGPVRELLPSDDRDWIEDHDVAMVATVRYGDDELAAVVTIGPKRGGVPFDNRDRWLIAGMAAAAATAWASSEATGMPHHEEEAAYECPECGIVHDSLPLSCACHRPAKLAALPRRVGNHHLVSRRLGAGGMGVVYLARDEMLHRDVALKTLPSLAPGAVAQLRDEARAMAALNHPSLATIFGLELWRRTPILVVEYFPAGTLADRLARGPLSLDGTIRLGIAMAGALSYMHERGLRHRDLKPSNIGMTASGAPKLLDFGLAGAHGHLPPETLNSDEATAAADLWALAVVLLECLPGANQFASDAPLRPFFERAFAREPYQRFRRADEMQSALQMLTAAIPS